MNALELEQKFGFEVFPKRDLTIVKGDGAVLWDDTGKSYIDCTAGVGVASIGHANPYLASAIAKQANALITCPGVFYNDKRARLVEKLIGIAPAGMERVFLCNSGTEANEAAIKFARHATGRTQFVSAMRGFHGRTLGALSATHKYRDQFAPLIPGFNFVPFNNLDKLEAAVTEETAAVILEPVQGEGGVRPGSAEYFQGVQALCRERGALLIMDEVQTGFGRTGAMFAATHFGVQPDLICLAKGIAGGVPMGAVLCGARVSPEVGMHGTTFGGNALACAAAMATLEYIEEHDLCAQAKRKGDLLTEALRGINSSRIREVRGLGLMIGIELKEKVKPHILALMENGVLALPAGATVLRLLPPLVITDQQLETAVAAIRETLSD